MNDESSTWVLPPVAQSRYIRARVDRRRRACDSFRADPSGDTRAGGPVVSDAHAGRSRKLDYLPRHLRDARHGDRSPDGTALTCLRVGVRRYPGLGRVSTITSRSVGLGAVLFVLVTVLDVVFAPFTGLESVEPVGEAAALQDLLASIPMRLLYGGITEILLRWGVMAPIAFCLLGASKPDPGAHEDAARSGDVGGDRRQRGRVRRRPPARAGVDVRSHDRADHPKPSC